MGHAIERAQTSLVAKCRDILDSSSSAGLSGLRVGNRFIGVTKMCNRVLQMKLMLNGNHGVSTLACWLI